MAPELDSDDENVEYEDDNGHPYRLYLDELDPSSSAAASNSSAPLQGRSQSGVFPDANCFFAPVNAAVGMTLLYHIYIYYCIHTH